MFFPLPLFTSYSYSSPVYHSSNDDYYRRLREEEEEEERRRKYQRQQLNESFKKDFEEYFKKQIKEIQDKITPDLFKIEPFYIEEISNLINLITVEEK